MRKRNFKRCNVETEKFITKTYSIKCFSNVYNELWLIQIKTTQNYNPINIELHFKFKNTLIDEDHLLSPRNS